MILFDDILDAVTAPELVEEDFNLSLHALAGTCSSATVQLRALVGNQVILIFVDSGSSHSFVNSDLCAKLQLPTLQLYLFQLKWPMERYCLVMPRFPNLLGGCRDIISLLLCVFYPWEDMMWC